MSWLVSVAKDQNITFWDITRGQPLWNIRSEILSEIDLSFSLIFQDSRTVLLEGINIKTQELQLEHFRIPEKIGHSTGCTRTGTGREGKGRDTNEESWIVKTRTEPVSGSLVWLHSGPMLTVRTHLNTRPIVSMPAELFLC